MGTTLAHAEDVLLRAENKWSNARGSQDLYAAYTDAVHDTYPALKQAFAAPDLAAGLHSAAYWNLLPIGSTDRSGWISATELPGAQRAWRAQNQALTTEIDHQAKAMQQARTELNTLKDLAARPGLPVVYDTNMLNHWRQPSDVRWREVLKGQGENTPQTRLVVPLCVVDELDRQKYGQGELAKRAATAIRFLESTLQSSRPGQPVSLRQGVTLEIWVDTDDRRGDTNLSILRCAADLANLHPDTGARVLTDDIGMRLRAQQMDLRAVRLPGDHRK
ncbi:PIN domain-containing protein [Streptomyces sp. NPDC058268]|uniref:PIN domain-containing protein n=1 Tax=Streptomyces sp. NPDC058268 TaxID=3346413 RepID=UPI0036E2D9F6